MILHLLIALRKSPLAEPISSVLDFSNLNFLIIILNSLTADIHEGQNPRYGRPGRIPSSKNIPFHNLLDINTGKFKPIEELEKIFEINKISKNKNIVNYCGGGIAASLEAFVLYQLGFKNIVIYDNSLHEWAATNQTLPMEND